jgi:hypothetical protein
VRIIDLGVECLVDPGRDLVASGAHGDNAWKIG